jgi:hypothetical protein
MILTGCIGLQTTPNFAQNGDVLSYPLGGLKRNADSQLISAADLTITLTDSASNQYTLPVLGIYRAYPDHTSEYAVNVQDRTSPDYSELYPNDALIWVSFTLRDANLVDVLPVLATGDANLSFASTKLTQTNSNDGSYTNIPLKIVSGVNASAIAGADLQFQAYRSYRYITIKPDATPVSDIGGAQIEIVYNNAFTSSGPFKPRAVPLNHNPNMSLIQSVTDNGNGTSTMRIFLTNPNGFVDVDDWQQGQSTFEDLALGITSASGILGFVATNAAIAATGTMDIVSLNSYYVDLNGDTVAGVSPMLVNEFDTT